MDSCFYLKTNRSHNQVVSDKGILTRLALLSVVCFFVVYAEKNKCWISKGVSTDFGKSFVDGFFKFNCVASGKTETIGCQVKPKEYIKGGQWVHDAVLNEFKNCIILDGKAHLEIFPCNPGKDGDCLALSKIATPY